MSVSGYCRAPELKASDLNLRRYRHPSHQHKLFLNIVRNMPIFCNNLNCKRRLGNNEVSYVCFRCDFDLCAHCFMLCTEATSYKPLEESDKDVNTDVLFRTERFPLSARTVRLVDEEQVDTLQSDVPHVDSLTFESPEYDDEVTGTATNLINTLTPVITFQNQ